MRPAEKPLDFGTLRIGAVWASLAQHTILELQSIDFVETRSTLTVQSVSLWRNGSQIPFHDADDSSRLNRAA